MLVDLGAFPALIPGDGIVEGVVLELDTEAMVITDRLEGFHPDRSHSLYLRKEIVVHLTDGQQVQARTYEFGDPRSISDQPSLIVRHRKNKPVSSWGGISASFRG